MADKRKSFRARRLAFGGRSLPRALLLAAALTLLTARLCPCSAQDAGLKNGAASLAAGKYDAAVRQLSATINSDSASPGDAAKALYLRGIAYRKLGESARAAADLGAAIWLGLPQADRVKALVNRGLAYQAAGLSKEGEAELAAARKLGGSREVDDIIAEGGGAPAGTAAIAAFATEVTPGDAGASSAAAGRGRRLLQASGPASAAGHRHRLPSEPPPTRTANASPGSWSTSVADESQPASSSGGNVVSRWWGSLSAASVRDRGSGAGAGAGRSTRSRATAQAGGAPGRRRQLELVHQHRSGSGLGRRRRKQEPLVAHVRPNRGSRRRGAAGAAASQRAVATACNSPPAAPRPKPRRCGSRSSKSQSLDGISPQIERVDIGNFGTFYSLRIGPFPDKAGSLKVCNALKRSGIDCSLAEQ